jgi:hypothetical protein
MSYRLLKQILLTFILISFCKSEAWVDFLKLEVESLSRQYPLNGFGYIVSLSSRPLLSNENFRISELDSKLNDYVFNEELKNKIRLMLMSDLSTFKGFTFIYMQNLNSIYEIAGVIRKINDRLDIVYVETITSGDLIQKYDAVPVQVCQSFLFWELFCFTYDKYIPRPYTLEEIDIISYTLRSNSYEQLKYYLDTNYQSVINGGRTVTDTLQSYLDITETSVKNQIEKDVIKEYLDAYSEDYYVKQLQSDSNLLRAIQEDKFHSIHPNFLDQFLSTFINNISNDIYEGYSIFLKMTLKAMESKMISNISSFKFFVTNNNSKLDLYEVYLSYNDIDNYYNIRIRSLKTEIKIESSFLVSKMNDENMSSLVHGNQNEKDITIHLIPLMRLFELLNQLR